MIEKFYVYRTLGPDNTWGAIILGDRMAERLPNLSFGMKIFAQNEKLAVAKAKEVYDKIHAYDSDKENVRRFISSVLKSLLSHAPNADYNDTQAIAEKALKIAVQCNDEYNKYFEELEKSE